MEILPLTFHVFLARLKSAQTDYFMPNKIF